MNITGGSTDVTTYFVLRLAADGTEATGLTITNFDLQYVRTGEAPVAKVDATALGATNSAHGDNQAIEIDVTDQPGLYRVDWPDAAFAAGVKQVILTVKCATCFTEHLAVNIDAPVSVTSMAAGVITATVIATNAIGADELADGAITAATFAAGAIDATAIANGAIDAATFAAGAIDATAIAANAIDAATFAADVDAEVRGWLGLATNNLDTQIGDLPTNAELATALGTADDAVLAQVALVKAKTDSLTFTVAGVVDANIQAVNDVTIVGDGSGTPYNV